MKALRKLEFLKLFDRITVLNGSAGELTSGSAALLAALLIAAALQVIAIARSPTIAPDGIVFVQMAKGLPASPVQTMRQADQHPGYPTMILGFHWLLAHITTGSDVKLWMTAARLCSGIYGLLCVAVIWSLAKIIFNPRVAAASALLSAVLPVFRQNASDALSDSPHLFFYLLSVYFFARGIILRRRGWFAACGASCGIAFWIRPEGLSPALVALLCLTLVFPIRSGEVGKSYATALELLLALLLVVTPYIVITGKLTSKKDPSKLLSAQTWQEKGGPTVLLLTAGYVIADRVMRGIRYFLLVPLLLGIASDRERPRRGPAVTTFVVLLIVLHLALMSGVYILSGYASSRHMLPAIALAIPWIALGSLNLEDWMNKRLAANGQRRAAFLSTAVLALFLIVLGLRSARPLNADRIPLLEVARQTAQQASAGDRLISNSPYVPFHAELPGRVLFWIETFPESAHSIYRFVVLDSRSNFNPEWLPKLLADYRPLPQAPQALSAGIVVFERR